MLSQLAPGYYLHQPDAIAELGPWLSRAGYHSAVVVSGTRSYQAAKTPLEDSLRQAGIRWRLASYHGECSDESALEMVRESGNDRNVVIGVGGGKVLDLSKLVSWELQLPLVTVPTLISNCAATTPNTVVYDMAERVKESRVGRVVPEMTLVDDTLLKRSPKSYFASGLGDTLAKPYEALVGATSRALLESAGLRLAQDVGDFIAHQGVAGLKAFGEGKSPPSLADLTDAVILMGSLVGGLGGPGLRGAIAHAFHNALTMLPEVHETLHGEKVAYGLMVQESLWGRPVESVRKLRELLTGLELPVNWAQLAGSGHLPDLSTLEELAAATLGSPLVQGRLDEVGVGRLVQAIRDVEAY